MLKRPLENEYPSYYNNYLKLVPSGNLLEILEGQLTEAVTLFSGLSEEQGNLAYANGKWTLKEVIGHMIDTERIMSYRLLRISRGDKSPLAGFSEEDYAFEGKFTQRLLTELVEELQTVRKSTISLFRGIPEHAWARSGTANELPVTARAIAYIIAGHDIHHMNMIKEKYIQ
ncbi:DinB family protein [Bacillus tianshenii]|uniref:DinB family protein n=1 Tax=Sutcliffiella tianshenii TaxID=1463404 RepID=UPI001CD211CA|nr:DinB family protein [Bacillus tianshenii]MCA1320627.1 DinB family protein [Bacillus tianshenii]